MVKSKMPTLIKAFFTMIFLRAEFPQRIRIWMWPGIFILPIFQIKSCRSTFEFIFHRLSIFRRALINFRKTELLQFYRNPSVQFCRKEFTPDWQRIWLVRKFIYWSLRKICLDYSWHSWQVSIKLPARSAGAQRSRLFVSCDLVNWVFSAERK